MQIITTHSMFPLWTRFDLNFMSASAGENDGSGSSEDSSAGVGESSVGGPGHGDGSDGSGGGFGMAGFGMQGRDTNPGHMSGASSAGEDDSVSGQYGIDMADFGGLVAGFGTGSQLSNRLGLIQALQRAKTPSMAIGAVASSVAGLIGGKLGSGLLGAVAGSLFGPMGSIVGGFIGSKYGKDIAQDFAEDLSMAAQTNALGPSTVGDLAGKYGMDPADVEQGLGEALDTPEVFEYLQSNANEIASGGTMATPAGTQASYEQQALDYLKARDEVPWQIGDAAMKKQAGIYGVPGYEEQGSDYYNNLTESPIYKAIMEGIPQGEQAVMRNASATGMLRSGNVKDALSQNAIDTNRQAVLDTLEFDTQGLSGLSGLPNYTSSIATTTAGIGETLAAGQLATQRQDAAEDAMWIGTALKGYEALGGYEGISDIATGAWDTVTDWFI